MMASTLVPLFFVALTASFAVIYCGADTVTTPPKFVVDLDLPPADRWTKVMAAYRDIVPMIHKAMKRYVPAKAIPLVEVIASDLEKYLPYPYAGEIFGIANALNISLGDITLLNLLYDVDAFCTSIVCQDTKGQIWHARNLDYSSTAMLRNVTISVDFQRQGQTVYSAITYAGYVGILSGQRPNAFTITVDERDKGAWWMNFLIALLDRGASPLSFLIRDTLELAETFESAVQELSDTDTEASAYIIIAGTQKDEGAVITKGRLEVVDVWRLLAPNRWYLVETNYDHWVPPPTDDDRRHPAMSAMNSTGPSQISVKSLFKVLSTVPVLNNSTTYSVVMSASQPSLMQAWIRHYPN